MDWDDLNLTELTLVAQDIDPEAHRGLGREALVSIIENADDASMSLPTRKVNKTRLRIMEHVINYWSQVSALVTCPASTKDPRACFQCTDVQVVECAVLNRKTFPGETT